MSPPGGPAKCRCICATRPVSGMADLGYGQGYKYAHDYPGNIVDQEYLPEAIRGTIYYEPVQQRL